MIGRRCYADNMSELESNIGFIDRFHVNFDIFVIFISLSVIRSVVIIYEFGTRNWNPRALSQPRYQ